MSKPVRKPRAVTTLPVPDVGPHEHLLEQDFKLQMFRALNAPKLVLPTSGATVRCWVQNCGGVNVRNRAGAVTGRFNAGPVDGAADLSGLVSVLRKWIGADGSVVESLIAPRLECELKVDHKHEDNQIAFGAMINRMGGCYVLIKYDHALSLQSNVERGVRLVDQAVAARVSGVPISVAA